MRSAALLTILLGMPAATAVAQDCIDYRVYDCLIGHVETAGEARGVATQGNYAYVA